MTPSSLAGGNRASVTKVAAASRSTPAIRVPRRTPSHASHPDSIQARSVRTTRLGRPRCRRSRSLTTARESRSRPGPWRSNSACAASAAASGAPVPGSQGTMPVVSIKEPSRASRSRPRAGRSRRTGSTTGIVAVGQVVINPDQELAAAPWAGQDPAAVIAAQHRFLGEVVVRNLVEVGQPVLGGGKSGDALPQPLGDGAVAQVDGVARLRTPVRGPEPRGLRTERVPNRPGATDRPTRWQDRRPDS